MDQLQKEYLELLAVLMEKGLPSGMNASDAIAKSMARFAGWIREEFTLNHVDALLFTAAFIDNLPELLRRNPEFLDKLKQQAADFAKARRTVGS
ncbi:hypothetical protein BLD44_017265 [Mastigocladus laminosus UU774]|nr:hypothetical protein BLD44_017265 [Mastigocladus laminosus UU774]